MRRANRMGKNFKARTKGDKLQPFDRGLKRKIELPDMNGQPKKVTNFLHKNGQLPSSKCSPTTECTKKITKLNLKTMSKPVKLNRTILLNDFERNNADSGTTLKTLNCAKSKTVETRKQESLQISNKHILQTDNSLEYTQTAPKKFKRITVTWP